MRPLKENEVKRHAFMLDLLRTETSTEDLDRYLSRNEYTAEDYDQIIEKSEQIKKIAEDMRLARYGK